MNEKNQKQIALGFGILAIILTMLSACKKEADSQILDPPFVVSTAFRFQYGYKDGSIGQAAAENITDIIFDAADNLYFADESGNRIRKITPDGIVSTVAGTGLPGFKDGPKDQAQLFYPKALTFDNEGNLYVAQFYAIRKIAPNGAVTTFLGARTPGIDSHYLNNGDTTRYPVIDGEILFETPQALTIDKTGNLYIAAGANNPQIVKITADKQISVFYGTPFAEAARTVANTSQVRGPNGLAFDQQGNLLISDSGLGIIKLTPNGLPVYFTGDGYIGHVDGLAKLAEFNSVTGAIFDKSGNLYVGDDKYIRKITPDGTVSTIAGSGNNNRPNTEPLKDGPGNQAQISNPTSMAFDSKGNLYVVDDGGIRKITFN